jgi:hypothetical protein
MRQHFKLLIYNHQASKQAKGGNGNGEYTKKNKCR